MLSKIRRFIGVFKTRISEIYKKKQVRWIFASSVLLLFISFFIPYWKLYPEISEKLAAPLHYNIHFGVDLIGAWWRVFMPTIVGFVILIVNSILAAVYWKKYRMLSYFCLTMTTGLMFFLVLASVFITLLNLTYD